LAAVSEVCDAIAESSLPYQEEFFFVLVQVPGKFSLHLDDPHLLAVQAGDYLRPPVLAKKARIFPEGCRFVPPDYDTARRSNPS
jgi:hypothetical protein